MTLGRRLQLFWRLLVGSTAGFIFIPAALIGYLRQAFSPRQEVPEKYRERLNGYQIGALVVIGLLLAGLLWWIFG